MTDDEGEINALLGQTVAGKYRVESVLGRGGMGAVYAATHLGINKRVALKFLDREAARDEDSVARFQREAEAASAVESAHIVQIFDSGTHDRQPYLVMELLSGEDLRTRLKRDKQLSIPDAVHVIAQVLRALARAHAAGIVHRDLKPDNVFLCRRDDDPMFVKIVDFGISKVARHKATNNTLTRRGTVLGTAFYMSPEQAQAFPDIDGRSDLFSLGAILFEALAGTPPHTGDAYEAILINICTKDAPNVQSLAPEVPDALARVIAKALSRDRTERYEDANEFFDDLVTAVPGVVRGGAGIVSSREPIPSQPDPIASARSTKTEEGTAVRTGKSGGRAQTLRTAVLVITVALGAFIGTVFLMRGSGSETESNAGARGGPAAEIPAATLTAGEAIPPPSSSSPLVLPAASSAEPKPEKTPKPPTPIAKPAAKPAPKPAPKPGPAGVATGLQIDTSGP
ncbi:MAG TPA: serine/threonine-protein kinase [Polyangiaceae bacterium]|nr:serine/threonine-protein kinase [Polyangiaceae bacterium]